MHHAMSELLDRYEAGLMSRRELLGALIAIALPSTTVQQVKPLVGVATQLNHVTLYVQDVSRSQDFYQSLFGMPILTHQNPGVNLRAGAGFVGLYPAGDRGPPRIDHMCLSVDHFDAATVLPKLHALKLNAEIARRGDTEELYFEDHDGIHVQIQDTSYRGGVGRLGNRNP
jgi:catechol 2,3-dioxygenase-like lactoylglutathione lyase family enzyme